MQRTHLFPATAALALSFAAAAASAAAPPPNAASMRAGMEQVANFRLTDGFLRNNLAYSLDIAQHPCQASIKTGVSMFRELQSIPLDQVVARYGANPQVHSMLARHGMTAHTAVVGGLAMFMAGMKYMSRHAQPGGAVSGEGFKTPAMQANLAFYQAHWPEIHANAQKIQGIVSEQMHANGREAACLRNNMQAMTSPASH